MQLSHFSNTVVRPPSPSPTSPREQARPRCERSFTQSETHLMRPLFLIGLLAGTAVACQNASAPRDAGSPALPEASHAAPLDLRGERASLIEAGNALSATI